MYTYTENKPDLAKRIADTLDSSNVEKVEIRKRRVVRKQKKWSQSLFKPHSFFICFIFHIQFIFYPFQPEVTKALSSIPIFIYKLQSHANKGPEELTYQKEHQKWLSKCTTDLRELWYLEELKANEFFVLRFLSIDYVKSFI